MKKLFNRLSVFLNVMLILQTPVFAQKSNLKLWYNAPATDWMTQALPIGNGYMGVMFFSAIRQKNDCSFQKELCGQAEKMPIRNTILV